MLLDSEQESWTQTGGPHATADLKCCSCGQSSSCGHFSSTATQICICTVSGGKVAVSCCLAVITCQDWIASCPRVSIEWRHLQAKKKVYRCFQRKALLTAGKKRKTRHKLHKADTKPLSIPDGTTDLCKVLQVQAKGWALNMLMQQRGKYMVGKGKRVVSLRCIKSMGMGERA